MPLTRKRQGVETEAASDFARLARELLQRRKMLEFCANLFPLSTVFTGVGRTENSSPFPPHQDKSRKSLKRMGPISI